MGGGRRRRDGSSERFACARQRLQERQFVAGRRLVAPRLVSLAFCAHEAPVLRELIDVGIVPRPGSSSSAPEGWRSYEIPMEPVDLSSSYIRELLSGYADLGDFLPANVIPLFEGARG